MQDFKPPLPFDVDLGAVLTPEVTVSDTTLLPSGQHAVTVEGTGFDPSLAIGTRPPFQGKQSGVYIAFGRYLDAWRPSQGAPSGSRTNPASPHGNGVAVKWAVPAASFPGGPPAQDPTNPSYTELRPDGSFSTVIQVDKAWLDSAAGNFGIYTYTGGGATVASYETYTALTFAKATPTVTLDAPATTVGTAATATVTVASEGGATGSVTLSEGDTDYETVDLDGGQAEFTLPDDLAAGDHELTASFTGNDNTEAGEDTATLTIGKHAATATITAADRRYGATPVVDVQVASPDGDATGAVVLRRGSTVVGTEDLDGGTARFSLPVVPAGAHALTATFEGNGTTAATTATGRLLVVRAVSTTRFALTRPTTAKAGRAAITVSSPTTTPTGRVTLTLRKGSKVVRTSTGLLRAGKVTIAVPKLAKGGYRVTVSYPTSTNVAGSSRAFAFTVR
jgi:hypothetical protein